MSAVEGPVAFDPAAFVADLRAAGCRVVVGGPIRPSDLPDGYFIAPSRGYPAVMARWSDAMEACPDHIERVVARLGDMSGWTS